MIDRTDQILQNFSYLITDYDFIVEKKDFDPQMTGNAFVTFKSSRIGIEIAIDRDQVLIVLGDRDEPRKKWFEFSNVLHHFSPSEVAYFDIAQLFHEKRANNISVEETWNEVLEAQLKRLAFLLRQYCEPILKGEFSMKKEIQEIQDKEVAKILKRLSYPNDTTS